MDEGFLQHMSQRQSPHLIAREKAIEHDVFLLTVFRPMTSERSLVLSDMKTCALSPSLHLFLS